MSNEHCESEEKRLTESNRTEYEKNRNTEQQALLNEVVHKQSNEKELSYEETKQRKDTKEQVNMAKVNYPHQSESTC